MADLTLVSPAAPALPAAAVDAASAYIRAHKSPATRRAYRSDFVIFSTWCADIGLSPVPASPDAVAAFIAGEADRGVKVSTIGRRLAAIRYAHRAAGHATSPTDHETVKAAFAGIRRTIGAARVKKAPATADRIKAMIADARPGLAGLRDRALLLLGFAGAFRRSEIVALDVRDIAESADGLRVTIRKSKTDQDGQGVTIGVPRGGEGSCPVAAVLAWLSGSGIAEGPIFRPVAKGGRVLAVRLSDASVAAIVKAGARRAGLPEQDFAGHSLRSGFLTSAAGRGATLFKMADQSRHKSVDTLRGYVRDAELFRDHAGAGLL